MNNDDASGSGSDAQHQGGSDDSATQKGAESPEEGQDAMDTAEAAINGEQDE